MFSYSVWVLARLWLGMGFFAARALGSLSVAWLRAGEAERRTGSALVSLSLGMCLHKRGQFPCLTAPTPLQVFHNCQTKHNTGGMKLLNSEFRVHQQPLLAVLPRFPLPSSVTPLKICSCPNSTQYTFYLHEEELANWSIIGSYVCLCECLCVCVWLSFQVLSVKCGKSNQRNTGIQDLRAHI